MLHYQKLFLNREGTIISTYGGRGVGNQKRKRKIGIKKRNRMAALGL